MRYTGTLIAVKDMEKSRRFYCEVLGLGVAADFGANVTLEGGVTLQTIDTWKSFIGDRDIILQNNACELYFEETDLDGLLQKLQGFDIMYVHELAEHSWGQRVVRFYDPDCHIIEVGEEIAMVVKRFADSGMTAEQVAARMDVPAGYVKDCLKRQRGFSGATDTE